MSDAEKDQAFTRFFHGSGAQSKGIEGTGLGLPLVRSIMNAHSRQVDLSDRPEGGLVVRLRFVTMLRSVPQPEGKKSPARRNNASFRVFVTER